MTLVRIDPRHGALWRDVHAMQFGVDAHLVLRDPEPWQERVVDELERGFPCGSAQALLADPSRLAWSVDAPLPGVASLVAFLSPVLETVVPDAHGAAVRSADAVDPAIVATVVNALTDAGWPAVWLAPNDVPIDPGVPIVLLGSHVVPPHMGVRCMREEVPHVPIAFTSSGAEVGPLVVPGRTACMACVDAHRTNADAAWPTLVSQLLLRPPPSVTMMLAVEAAAAASAALQERLLAGADRDRAVTRSVRIEAGALSSSGAARARHEETHLPHPSCLCRHGPRLSPHAPARAA